MNHSHSTSAMVWGTAGNGHCQTSDIWRWNAFLIKRGAVIIVLSRFQVLGPKHVGFNLLLPLTFFYVVVFISGVVGNIAVCLVIVKNKSMHTATNYYLFSLAISDLMILLLGEHYYYITTSFYDCKIVAILPYPREYQKPIANKFQSSGIFKI